MILNASVSQQLQGVRDEVENELEVLYGTFRASREIQDEGRPAGRCLGSGKRRHGRLVERTSAHELTKPVDSPVGHPHRRLGCDVTWSDTRATGGHDKRNLSNVDRTGDRVGDLLDRVRNDLNLVDTDNSTKLGLR